MSPNKFLLPVVLLALAPAPAVRAATPAAATPAAAPAPSRVEATFAAWDTNKDHVLSLAEFQAGWAALQKATLAEMRLRQQFRAVDTDKDGAIEAGEYANLVLVKRLGKAAPAMSAFDANKDQRLEFPEYVELVRKLAAQPAPASPAAGRK